MSNSKGALLLDHNIHIDRCVGKTPRLPGHFPVPVPVPVPQTFPAGQVGQVLQQTDLRNHHLPHICNGDLFRSLFEQVGVT